MPTRPISLWPSKRNSARVCPKPRPMPIVLNGLLRNCLISPTQLSCKISGLDCSTATVSMERTSWQCSIPRRRNALCFAPIGTRAHLPTTMRTKPTRASPLMVPTMEPAVWVCCSNVPVSSGCSLCQRTWVLTSFCSTLRIMARIRRKPNSFMTTVSIIGH